MANNKLYLLSTFGFTKCKVIRCTIRLGYQIWWPHF